MEQNLIQGECGQCGSVTFEIYSNGSKDSLILECTQCKSTSEITISKPKIDIRWHNDSLGILHF